MKTGASLLLLARSRASSTCSLIGWVLLAPRLIGGIAT
ncbi:hypothetical protein T266_09015 [Pseudomonas aeruginosa VRFPA05]|nr:hypothetical protein T266_09015 [Pseudomonas aeruginosa VRFPA05]